MATREQIIKMAIDTYKNNPNDKSYLISNQMMRALVTAGEQVQEYRTRKEMAEHQIKDLKRQKRNLESRIRRLSNMAPESDIDYSADIEESPVTPVMQETMSYLQYERLKQLENRGIQRMTFEEWMVLTLEEIGEVSQAIQVVKKKSWVKPTDKENLFEEWIHAATVILQAAEQAKEEMGNGQAVEGRAQTDL